MATPKEARRRGNRRENRHEKRQQQHSGSGEWDCIRPPEGLELFKPEKGETYHIDVIPYIVGKHNRNASPGDEYFELSYPVYRDLGVDEKKFIAIKELKDVPDPVAEHFAYLRKQDAEWDDMKKFKPTWRQLMLIFVHEQADKGLQFFEAAYGTFGELLDEEIKANESEHVDNFDDPDGGSTLAVRFKAKSIGQTNPWVLAAKIDFIERESGFDANGNKKLAAEILQKASTICLDDCLKIPTYDQLKAALEGRPVVNEDGEDEDTPPAKPAPKQTPKATPAKEKTPPPPEDEGEDDGAAAGGDDEIPRWHKGDEAFHEEHGNCQIIRISDDGLTCSLRDEDGTMQKNVRVAELEAREQAAPAKPAPAAKAAPAPEKPAAKAAPAKPAPAAKAAPAKSAPAPEKSAEKSDTDWDADWED